MQNCVFYSCFPVYFLFLKYRIGPYLRLILYYTEVTSMIPMFASSDITRKTMPRWSTSLISVNRGCHAWLISWQTHKTCQRVETQEEELLSWLMLFMLSIRHPKAPKYPPNLRKWWIFGWSYQIKQLSKVQLTNAK